MYVPYDMSRVKVLDLSQSFSMDSPSFAFYEGPTVKWVKRLAFEGVNAQFISTTNHIATHLDSPYHFYDPGPDIAGIPLDKLMGPACIVDLEKMGILKYIITQNVDNLHRVAGSLNVAEIHGNSSLLRCVGCNSRFTREAVGMESLPPVCTHCGGLIKIDAGAARDIGREGELIGPSAAHALRVAGSRPPAP